MGVDAHVEAAVAAVARAEEVVAATAASLGLAVGRAIGEVFDATPDLDAVELWVDDYDDLMLRASFRGRARYDADEDCLTEAADVEHPEATENACIALGDLHSAVHEVGALRRWIRAAVDSGTAFETPERFWTREFEGAPETFQPGDPLKLVAGRYARHVSGDRSGAVVVAFVGPTGASEAGLDVLKIGAPRGDLCLRYTRERRGPVVASRTIEVP